MINLLSGLNSTSAALGAERLRMDVVTQNISNMNVAKGADGLPYQRQQVVFESFLDTAVNNDGVNSGSQPYSVRVARVEKDTRPPRMVYNPGHPDANGAGMVALPNIDLHQEMVDLMASSRSYEANLAVITTARGMAMQTLQIGKR